MGSRSIKSVKKQELRKFWEESYDSLFAVNCDYDINHNVPLSPSCRRRGDRRISERREMPEFLTFAFRR